MKARVYVIQFTKFAICANDRFDSQALAPINISDSKYITICTSSSGDYHGKQNLP